MKVIAKLASVSLAAALVGSVAVGGASAADAAAKPKVTGKAVLTFDAGMGQFVNAIHPVSPAAFFGASLGFPVKSADAKTIVLGGSFGLGTTAPEGVLSSPYVEVTSESLKTGSFKVSIANSPTTKLVFELFAITHFTKKTTGKTTTWTGDLQVSRNPADGVSAETLASSLSALVGHTVNPGDKMGRITVTVNTK